MTFKPHTALITGGGTGIGRGLAEALHERGTKVVIAGRRQEVLEKVCAENKGMEWVLLDVADPNSITKCRDELVAKHSVDCVINNAGMQQMHDFAAEEPVDLHFADKEAAVHSYTQSLRFQLKDTAVKVIELEPPAVQTELHDYMGAHGRSIGITLPDFVRETMESLDAGLEDFAVANAKNLQGVVDAERFAKAFAATNSISA